MHKFELGVWKALFTHLVCILYAAGLGGGLVANLDERYSNHSLGIVICVDLGLIVCRFRQIPPFSQATICRFTNNVSQMKKLAARNFEDLLQCSIPAFEDLLDKPHNKPLMKLLYWTAEWHSFAKLRVHTDSTLKHLEMLTKEFGNLMQQFRDLTCSKFTTTELPRESCHAKQAAACINHWHCRVTVTLSQVNGSSSDIESLNNKVSFTWRLRADDTNVWMY